MKWSKTDSFSQWEKHTMKTRRSNCCGTSDASWRTTVKTQYFLAALWKHIQNNINWSRTLLEICELLVQPSLLWKLIGTAMAWGVEPHKVQGEETSNPQLEAPMYIGDLLVQYPSMPLNTHIWGTVCTNSHRKSSMNLSTMSQDHVLPGIHTYGR